MRCHGKYAGLQNRADEFQRQGPRGGIRVVTWIALADLSGRRMHGSSAFRPGGLALMPRGTLVIEAQIGTGRERPLPLVDCRADQGWRRLFSVILYPQGQVELTIVQGVSETRGDVRLALPATEEIVRISYGWDAPARRGFLALELPDTGVWARAPVEAPSPLPWSDLAAVLGLSSGCAHGRELSLVALSDRLEPVGPVPGIGAGTPVRTAAGWKPVEAIAPGDLVHTAWGGLRPVLALLSREMPVLGRHAPVRLTAPALGLRRDVTVAPDHRMLVAGGHAEYAFGEEAVLAEARHLARTRPAASPGRRMVCGIRYHQLLLDAHDCLMLAGAWGESMRVPSQGDLRGTVLDLPGLRLPPQRPCRARGLMAFEARELASVARA